MKRKINHSYIPAFGLLAWLRCECWIATSVIATCAQPEGEKTSTGMSPRHVGGTVLGLQEELASHGMGTVPLPVDLSFEGKIRSALKYQASFFSFRGQHWEGRKGEGVAVGAKKGDGPIQQWLQHPPPPAPVKTPELLMIRGHLVTCGRPVAQLGWMGREVHVQCGCSQCYGQKTFVSSDTQRVHANLRTKNTVLQIITRKSEQMQTG